MGNDKKKPTPGSKHYSSFREAISSRLKKFRKALGKTQKEWADEMNINQYTIKFLEAGKASPCVSFIHYLGSRYDLNAEWLINGNGYMVNLKHAPSQYIEVLVTKNDLFTYNYVELLDLMNIPEVQEMIFERFCEIKEILKKEIEEYNRSMDEKSDGQ